MTEELDRAREELQAATESAESVVAEQLESIDEGLMELAGSDKTRDEPIHADRLVELEKKLAGLREETEGETERHVATAAALVRESRERREDRGR